MQLITCNKCEERVLHLEEIIQTWCRMWRAGAMVCRDMDHQKLHTKIKEGSKGTASKNEKEGHHEEEIKGKDASDSEEGKVKQEEETSEDDLVQEEKIKVAEDIEKPRTACETAISLMHKLSYIVSSFLKPLIKLADEPKDPTEDMLYRIRMCNEYNSLHDAMIGAFVIQPRPQFSYHVDSTVERCLELLTHAQIDFENVRFCEVGLYLAKFVGASAVRGKCLSEFLPTRDNRPSVVSRPLGSLREDHWKGWRKPVKTPPPGQEEGRTMVGMVVDHTLKLLLQHTVCFNRTYYAHTRGGDALEMLQGHLEKLYLVWWDGELTKMMARERIDVKMYKRYGEQCVVFVNKIPEFGEKNLEKSTMEKIRNVSRKVDPDMLMNMDYPSNYPNGRVPVMDTEQWIQEVALVEGGKKKLQILHSHYAKVISHKHFSDMKSEMPRVEKMSILTDDLVRIMRNVSHLCASTERISKVQEYIKLLTYYGYTQAERITIYKRAKQKHDKMLDQEELELYQSKYWSSHRKRKSKKKKSRTRRTIEADAAAAVKSEQLQSRFFEDAALQTLAKQRYENIMNTFGYPVKVVERCSSFVRDELRKVNPFEATKCEGRDCRVCTNVRIKALGGA